MQSPKVAQDARHFKDGVVAALRRRAVTAHAFGCHLDLHAASVTPVDLAVGRFCNHNEFRFNFIFIEDVLPAKAIAVFFLHRANYQQRVVVFQLQIFDDFSGIHHGGHAAFLITGATPDNDFFVLKPFIRIIFPVFRVADAYRVNVGVHGDKVLSMSDIAENITHRINFHFIEADFFHFFFDSCDNFFFFGTFTGNGNHIP